MALEPAESPGFLLWRATLRWQRAISATLAPFELTHVQFVLLASAWWLNGQGESPNQLAVARHAGTDVKMTSEVLRSLERKGMIVREIDPSDTRSKRVLVTDRGRKLAPTVVAAVERTDAEFFGGLADARVLAALRRLAGE
jgi:DNA-binding MarR family transcriptional regulator